jgi:lysophospholipase L1-like esterase
MLRRVLLTALLVAALGIAAEPAVAAPAPPARIAALGDSITRAFDVSGSYFLRDAPAESWSTGTDTKVNSEYQRLKALNGSIAAENDAVTGTTMSSLAGQMSTALSHNADYITVLMGANDVCTKTVAGMTPTDTFRSGFEAAMALTQGRNVRVFVSSIPNVNRLYSLFASSSSAKFAWSLYGVCQDLLSSKATSADRDAVAAQVTADNAALEAVCTSATYAASCTWDGGATYNVAFAKTDVSTVDYFHPSVSGQAKLASTAWTASPYGH